LLLGTDNKRNTAWHRAAAQRNSYIIEKLWEWANKNLTTEEIKIKLLLSTENKGNNFWQRATLRRKSETLQKLWEWAKKPNNRGDA
jgi:hypothetical protein